MGLLRAVLGLLPRLWGNWVSLLGTTVVTVTGNMILIVAVVDLAAGRVNQYLATVAYLIMPLGFIGGLLLIALGLWWDRRRGERRADTALGRAVEQVMSDRAARRRVAFVVVATVANITLISVAAYKGITYMESTRFCGQLCHSVMEPEYTTYRLSPHQRVDCVECHIGEGASWFVKSKLSGLRQVWAVATGDFSRPIPAPIENLRPAQETCEQCHWPAKFHGSRMMVTHAYKNDEPSTQLTSAVRLKVGGVDRRTGRFEGIHWHVAPGVRITYESLTRERSVVGRVFLDDHGKKRVYKPTSDAAKGKEVHERRVMDCVDCHNRPTHIYDPSPEVAVDRALTYGKIDRGLPFIRKVALEQLQRKIADTDEAAARFTAALRRYYTGRYPEVARAEAAQISRAGRELGWIYRRNIYPRMNIWWGTYPSHLGHKETTEGCFRCHDYEHVAEGDHYIRQDCDVCHDVLAQEEEKPDIPEALLRLGRM